MTPDQHTEYGGGPGNDRRMPNGELRPLNTRERAQIIRMAGRKSAADWTASERDDPLDGLSIRVTR